MVRVQAMTQIFLSKVIIQLTDATAIQGLPTKYLTFRGEKYITYVTGLGP